MSSIGPEKYVERKSIIPKKHDQERLLYNLIQAELDKTICIVADKRSINVLIDLLDDKEYDVRWIAAESLIRIGRKSIVPLLLTIRDGKHFIFPGKAHHVLQCLLTRSEKKALQSLLRLLTGNYRNGNAAHEASCALKYVFRYIN